jgi:DNA-binding NtrC family response regulator
MRPDKDDDHNSSPAVAPVILLVEDEVLVRLDLADYLRRRGFTVLEASSVGEAEAVLTAGVAIDLVFTDINLLGPRDGVELAQWIQSHFPHVPVMLTSGMKSALLAAKVACAHVTDFITKPYDHAAVEQRIRALVGRRGAVGP